jgi:lysophospholipase L1-like esterase
MKQILCFGDSNTYGLIPGTKNRYGWGIRWTSLVDEHFRRMGYRVTEEGLCGRTTFFQDATRPGRKGTELLPVLLEAHSPIDLLVLMLGTNDCKTSYQATPEKIGEGIEALLDQIQSTHPEIQILLVSPISLGDRVWEEGYDTEFDRNSVEVSRQLPFIYAEIAKRRGVAFLAASDFADPSSTDREHLDMLGHKRLAQAILAKLQEMLGQKRAEENVS